MGYFGATLTQVFTRARGADVSLSNVTIAQMGNGDQSAGDVTQRKRVEDLGDFEKISWVETRHRKRRVDYRGSQRADEFARYGRRRRWGGQMKKLE